LLFIVASVMCQLAAVLLLKQQALLHPASGIADVFVHPLYWMALGCLGLQALFWQKVLARHALSFAYPLNSLIYPATLVAGWFLFGEAVTLQRLAGSGVILAGIWVVSSRPL
jgi:drug/metabolite transporter (DMT)-like permease